MKVFISVLLFLTFSFQPVAKQEKAVGSVRGTLCYPGHYIPQMIVYLKNIKSGKVYKTPIKEDQKTFRFSSIPVGTYVAYAYTVEKTVSDHTGKSFKGSGGYTKMVPCGLSVDCKDQSLIAFHVTANKQTSNIAICDWYGPELPKE